MSEIERRAKMVAHVAVNAFEHLIELAGGGAEECDAEVLCGSPHCHAIGCNVLHLADARALVAELESTK